MPILFNIGPIPIRAFGMTAALAFLLGLWVALREGRRVKLDTDRMQNVAIWIFIGVIGGGRLLFVLVNLPHYLEHPISVFKIWEGGLVLYGGLILAFVLGMWSIRRNRLPLWKTTDVYLMAGMLGLTVARIGCLCVGDDWGRVAPGITVIFPAGDYVARTEYAWEPMHPGRARQDIRAVTSNPDGLVYDRKLKALVNDENSEGLYDEKTVIQQKGKGQRIESKGYAREPTPMVVRILEGDSFEYSTDGGKSFSSAIPRPEGWTEEIPGGKEDTPATKEMPGRFTVPGTKLPWAIRFGEVEKSLIEPEFVGEWVHPTQIYLSLSVFSIFCILFVRHRRGKRFDGELVATGIVLYAILRFVIEFYRGDVPRGMWGGLSTSQWISMPFLGIGAYLYITLYRKARRRERAAAKNGG